VKPLSVDSREYLIVNQDLLVVEASDSVSKFADSEESEILGQDVREVFPELVGIETTLRAIFEGEEESFLLEGIARNLDEDSLVYFDLVIQRLEEQLVIYLADVSELMVLKQSLVQRANEAEVLLSALRRFEDYTNKILTSMADVFLITTASGQIKQVNQATEQLFGYTKSELLHQPVSFLVVSENFNHQDLYSTLIRANTSVQQIELTCRTKEGKIIEVEFSCSIIETEVKGVFNCVYIGRDITARKEAEAKIRQALAKEKELRELKSGFISMASHEFRNPLSSILICTDSLKKNISNLSEEEASFYLDLIDAAAKNMQSLLEDVLIISRTETDRLQFTPTSLNLENFARQIIREILLTVPERNINFICDRFNSPVIVDKKLLRYILTNLLSNAIKYSASETTVDLVIRIDSESDNQVILEVRDRGIGIPQEAQKHLFESFYRAQNVGDTPGTGLGLSIVKKAVELHQGEITIDSQVGIGTTVKVILPLSKTTKIN
jgi:PAS domain S-box-containing protein